MSGLRVLLTGIAVADRTGAELYVVEVARALAGRGHDVSVLTPVDGPLAETLRRDGIPVRTRLPFGGPAPEVIHAQGEPPARSALARYPGVPALYVCHQHHDWRNVIRPRECIRRYAGVSQVCADSLLEAGAPPERVMLLPNFVDTARFTPRSPLPPAPRRAVAFSNRTDGWCTDGLVDACRAAGIELDVLGAAAGTATPVPHEVLQEYDLVFGKGRAAIEALAVGCAVVLCDFAGSGPMVTSKDWDRLRIANFGFAELTRSHDADVLLAEIRRYDAADAAAVSARIRAEAGLDRYVEGLERLYATLLVEGAAAGICRVPVAERVGAEVRLAAYRWYCATPEGRRARLHPLVQGARAARAGVARAGELFRAKATGWTG